MAGPSGRELCPDSIMILRDPVHGLIAFEERREALIAPLLATREVQRLRRVRQLGLASLVFPGAEHSRFAHAVGAAFVMSRLLDRLERIGTKIRPEAMDDAIAAALLHDLGHGPFSHLYEDVLPRAKTHEEWTITILRDPSTEIHRALERWREGMSEDVIALLEGRSTSPVLSRAVSGTLDVDRMDYLLRDSLMTGVSYGLYDLDWLLEGLTVIEHLGEPRIAILGRKGIPPIEAFFLGRHHMYQQVYHHKAVRAAETLVRGLFKRLAELVLGGEAPPGVPRGIEAAIVGKTIESHDYLNLDDSTLIAATALWEESGDPELAGFAEAIRTRKLPKTIPLSVEAREVFGELVEELSALAESKGLRADLHVSLDEPVDIPYREDPNDPSSGFWVSLRHREPARLGDVSFVLRELRNKPASRPRLVFPESLRNEAVAITGARLLAISE